MQSNAEVNSKYAWKYALTIVFPVSPTLQSTWARATRVTSNWLHSRMQSQWTIVEFPMKWCIYPSIRIQLCSNHSTKIYKFFRPFLASTGASADCGYWRQCRKTNDRHWHDKIISIISQSFTWERRTRPQRNAISNSWHAKRWMVNEAAIKRNGCIQHNNKQINEMKWIQRTIVNTFSVSVIEFIVLLVAVIQ